ncbi:MAG: glycosyltransferase [Bacteroides sp.]|nr:glycosyltransferase [Roseburia sp.]MCM1346923.1 glycosyltransferase [Bacteroides sp.]MCM1421454.1 glycosyltransferase [Bacteroides sp.]
MVFDTENIKFSIAIPAYKGFYLREAIESCLAQTYRNFEVIIVDDASPENLRGIVEVYLKDPRIRFYRNEKNCGAVDVVDNWNICLGYCTGDYVICMGDDDRLIPTCLEDYAMLMDSYPGLGVYHAQTELIDENGTFYDIQHPRPTWESALSLLWNRWNGRDKQYIGDFCFYIKVLRKCKGFYKLPLAWASDDITAVMAASEKGIANTKRIGFQYRVNRYTISKTGNIKEKIAAVIGERKWYENFLESYSVHSDLDEKYTTLIKRQLPEHFRLKIKALITTDMGQNACNVFHWILHRKQIGLSVVSIGDSWVTALKRRMK